MCAVSAVISNWEINSPHWPKVLPNQWPTPTAITLLEFEALKKEVQELKELLKAAKKFDDATGQPDCEKEEKVALLKRVAEVVGIDLSECL